MEKLKAWIKENKTTAIIIAVGVVVLLVVLNS